MTHPLTPDESALLRKTAAALAQGPDEENGCCRLCHQSFSVRDGCDPVALCMDCALEAALLVPSVLATLDAFLVAAVRSKAALEALVDADGDLSHDEDCPGDDTCDCSVKPLHAQVNFAHAALEKALAVIPALDARVYTDTQAVDGTGAVWVYGRMPHGEYWLTGHFEMADATVLTEKELTRFSDCRPMPAAEAAVWLADHPLPLQE